MILASVSSQYLGTAMIPAVNEAQSQFTQLEIESSTGQYADLGLHSGDQSGYELSLRNQNAMLQGLTSDNNVVATNLAATQDALDSMRTSAQNTLQSLSTWSAGANSEATLQRLGSNALQQFIGLANTTSGNSYVFGGINTGTAPLAAYSASPPSGAKSAIDAAFQSAFGVSPADVAASTISGSQMQTFLTGPFAAQFSGASWTENWSAASSTNTSAAIAPGQVIDTSANANQPGFRQLAQAYAMLAEFGSSELGATAQQVVASTASSLISQGLQSLTATEANVGAAQDRVTQANSQMNSQMTILQTQVGNLDNVNADAVATQLNALMTQIETAYRLTAQIQKISLAQYLPA
jgi:flagellar hook-associated protein 3 FlgL